MVLIRINDISISFGGPLVLEKVSMQIQEGERIGLVGRNGCGKSTLLKLINGDIHQDEGTIVKNSGIRVAMLSQEVPHDLPGTVYDIVASGGKEHMELLREYHTLTKGIARESNQDMIRKLEQVQYRLEACGAWRYHQKVEEMITRTELDENAEFQVLSAGLKRRVFLARALVDEPDLLLLDEPTNHLDISSILWLEDFLSTYERTFMFVTHDRDFLRRLATRIVEIDRASLFSYECSYNTYLERRQARFDAEERNRTVFDKKLAQEEIWIRKGIKARRTRNEGRVRALMEMRRERAERRHQDGRARLVIQEAQRSGTLVVDAENISFSYGDNMIVDGFSTTILRGDKVGVIGPNGSGKTTLLKILLGKLKPQEGSIRLGSRTEIAYFDQIREQLDEDKTVKENVAGGNDKVFVGGEPRHVVGYLQDFLFSKEKIMSPVRSLSGGERNRLLLAKLFAAPSNVLVLDEPTNDLDAETLELLEERLMEYTGTVLMVSHDRAFLNNVVTSVIAFEGRGRLQEYVGGYDDWLRQRPVKTGPEKAQSVNNRSGRQRPAREKTKLSYKEAHELEELPVRIDSMEKEKNSLEVTLNDPEFQVKTPPADITAANDKLERLDTELDEAYRRWAELEEMAEKFGK